MERYVTLNIGQNRSITYESWVQMEVTVAARGRLMQTGCGSALPTDRCALESRVFSFCSLASSLPYPISCHSPLHRRRFSPVPRYSVSDISQKIP